MAEWLQHLDPSKLVLAETVSANMFDHNLNVVFLSAAT